MRRYLLILTIRPTNHCYSQDSHSEVDVISLDSEMILQNAKRVSELNESELERRAIVVTENFAGINPLFEAFYIRSVLYSASRAREAFERFTALQTSDDTAQNQVSLIHEALGHAAALSRFFWPSNIGGRRMKALKSLKEARAKKMREAFSLTDDSPLKNRTLRDCLEHFDERLDEYLLKNHGGYFFPDAIIGDAELADDAIGHIFKLVDPNSSCFVLLGEKYFFEGIKKEVYRIYESARQMDENGCRLRQCE